MKVFPYFHLFSFYKTLCVTAMLLGYSCEGAPCDEEKRDVLETWTEDQDFERACAGVHKNDFYATIEYFLIEGFDDEAGGKYHLIYHLNYKL